MNKREALEILLRAAQDRCRGAGQGLTSLPSQQERSRIIEAAQKVWKYAYNFPIPKEWP